MSVAVSPARVVRRKDLSNEVVSGFSRTAVASGLSRKTSTKVALRTATAADADAIHALIVDHLAEGHLLPRERGEIAVHAARFVVAAQGDRVVACAELAPLSRSVAEVRSLVVGDDARLGGVGRTIVNELRRRAALGGYDKLCAFTHTPAYFVHMGFSIVPHTWVPEKIWTDCSKCAQFRTCGQYALVATLT
jgi:amino-acid N-acetyltransferase